MTNWKDTTITTLRLILRPWRDEDAEALYRFASDPLVGPPAGWPPHTSVENSREIIRGVLSARETYAIVLRYGMRDFSTGEIIPGGTPVGSVGIMFRGCGSHPRLRDNEAEIGYWICRPLWGRELVPEAVEAIMARCFDTLGMERLWCGYYENNDNSRRVQQKCGFLEDIFLRIPPHPLNGATMEYFTTITRVRWQERRDVRPFHILHLKDAPFKAILSGRKRVELRLCDMKRRLMEVGHFILFVPEDGGRSYDVRITALHAYANFEELYADLIPRLGAEALGYEPGDQPNPDDMLKYYQKELIDRHGVMAIEFTERDD